MPDFRTFRYCRSLTLSNLWFFKMVFFHYKNHTLEGLIHPMQELMRNEGFPCLYNCGYHSRLEELGSHELTSCALRPTLCGHFLGKSVILDIFYQNNEFA